MAPVTYWHAPPSDQIIVQALDSLTAVFDRRSGQTHILSPPLPELLEMLALSPVTIDELAMRLSETFDLDGAEDGGGNIAGMLAARLAELAALGLVEAR